MNIKISRLLDSIENLKRANEFEYAVPGSGIIKVKTKTDTNKQKQNKNKNKHKHKHSQKMISLLFPIQIHLIFLTFQQLLKI